MESYQTKLNSINLKSSWKKTEILQQILEMLSNICRKSHILWMSLEQSVSVMGLEDKETSNNSPEANMRKAIRIFAKTPTAIAAFF